MKWLYSIRVQFGGGQTNSFVFELALSIFSQITTDKKTTYQVYGDKYGYCDKHSKGGFVLKTALWLKLEGKTDWSFTGISLYKVARTVKRPDFGLVQIELEIEV